MFKLYKNVISNFIKSNDRINIKIDRLLINHLFKKSELDLSEIKQLNNFINKEYFSRKKLFKDLSTIYDTERIDNIIEKLIESNINLTGRPNSQNYPIY